MAIPSISETAEQYINRVSRIELDFVHSTLQECLNGCIDESLVTRALDIVEAYRDNPTTTRTGGTTRYLRIGSDDSKPLA